MLNKVMLIGNLGKDPDVRYTPSGAAVANFSLATNKKWKDKESGEKKEQVEWHQIVVWGKTAEVAGEYLKKGSQVYLEGELRTRKCEDKEGKDRYTTEVHCYVMQMLGSKGEGGGNRPPHSTEATTESGGGAEFSDEIPF